jgi:hypothetical protein
MLQFLGIAWFAATANAQDHSHSAFQRNLTSAGVNAAIGGLTAGVSQAIAGKSFWNGFARGAGGGFAVFAGKRIIAERTPLAWWTGRQLAAIGSSEVANAARGRMPFQLVTIPLGPARFHFQPRRMRLPSVTLDVASTITAMAEGTSSGSRFALQQSLATGAFVFITRERSSGIGGNAAGVITMSEQVPNGNFPLLESERDVISHELIHSAQYDFILTAWADPIQTAVAGRLPRVKPFTRYFDFNLVLPVQALANQLISYDARPWEQEALSFVSIDR